VSDVSLSARIVAGFPHSTQALRKPLRAAPQARVFLYTHLPNAPRFACGYPFLPFFPLLTIIPVHDQTYPPPGREEDMRAQDQREAEVVARLEQCRSELRGESDRLRQQAALKAASAEAQGLDPRAWRSLGSQPSCVRVCARVRVRVHMCVRE
jgi:hypothetical protein